MLQIPEAAQWLPQNTPAFLEAKSPLMLPEVARQLGLTETQIVEAIARVRGERMELYLNGRSIEVPPGWRMSPGQTVWLTAHSTTQGLWVLRQHASKAIAQRALQAAGSKASAPKATAGAAASVGPAASGAAGKSGASTGAQTAAAAAQPATDPAQAAAAARVERAKVVLQARAEGQDPARVLAKQGDDGVKVGGGKLATAAPMGTAPAGQSPLTQGGRPAAVTPLQSGLVAAAFKPSANVELKSISAQDAQALQRGVHNLVGGLTRAASPASGLSAAGTVALSAAPPGVNTSLTPYLQMARAEAGLMGPSATPTRFQSSLGGAEVAATHHSAHVSPKWATAWSQAGTPQPLDWSSASPRVRELAAHPAGMHAVMQLFQPEVVAALMQNPALAQWAEQVYQGRLSMRKPEAQGIQALVERVLQPAESQIAQGQAAQQNQGLRTMLVELLRSFKVLDEAQSSLVRAALNDVESAQLDHVRALQQREWTFQCVLPFADAPPVQLELHREPESEDHQGVKGGARWWVNLFTESQDLGQVWMRSGVTSNAEVEMQVWATREHVVSDARARADDLGGLLSEAGLSLASFVVIHGEKPARPSRMPPPHGTVLDQQA